MEFNNMVEDFNGRGNTQTSIVTRLNKKVAEIADTLDKHKEKAYTESKINEQFRDQVKH
jgi:hypothetical protein